MRKREGVGEMTIQAYVLIGCSQDPADVVRGVRRIQGVKAAHALYGALEAIAFVEAESLKDLDRVIGEMYQVAGLRNTDTRIVRPD